MPRPNATSLISMSCLAVFLSQLGMMMYLPALPAIAQALNTTHDLTSLALPVYLAGMALPMLLWGAASFIPSACLKPVSIRRSAVLTQWRCAGLSTKCWPR